MTPAPAEFAAAPLDQGTKLVTGVVGVLVLIGLPLAVAEASDARIGGLLALAGLLLLGTTYAFAPASYALDGTVLEVRRHVVGPRRYQLGKRVTAQRWELRRGDIRLFGTGGVFGHFGKFRRRGVGTYRMHVTERWGMVAVPTESGELVVVSPADLAGFEAAVKAAR